MYKFGLLMFGAVCFLCSIFACSPVDEEANGGDDSTDKDTEADSDEDNGDDDTGSASVDDDSETTDTETVDTETADTETDDTETVEIDTAGCGNGVIEFPEVCDDGNSAAQDGCAVQCDAIEDGFVCPIPGEPCVYTIVCGDGKVSGSETCDDFDTDAGDGCAADCQLETGWRCPDAGEDCIAAECGDGLIIGKEECDDGNAVAADGCSDTCRLEDGWACDSANAPCHKTFCNDGVKEGKEPCDDGNTEIGDGCTPFCQIEPDCSAGACSSTCGDGFILPGDAEECDDGNQRNNDGCSVECKVELGFQCTNVEDVLPEILEVPIIYRDFILSATANGVRHPDFEAYLGSSISYGLVEATIGADGNPVYSGGCEALLTDTEKGDTETVDTEIVDTETADTATTDTETVDTETTDTATTDTETVDTETTDTETADTATVDTEIPLSFAPLPDAAPEPQVCQWGPQITSAETFAQWYSDVPDVNITKVTKLALEKQVDETYFFENDSFFPLDDDGWVAAGMETDYVNGHNFGFTSELRYWFKYEGNEALHFTGDDDVWVFINGQLVVDIGGVHGSQVAEVVLDEILAAQLGLDVGKIYEIVLFHAERHTSESHYNLTLSGFTTIQSTCESICGDGIVAGDETCDDGVNDGSYGSCKPDCTRGDRCGDGVVQAGVEVCDDGINLSVYSDGNEPGCAPGCVPGAWCGDGVLSSLFGEQCDDGINPGGHGECAPDCMLDVRCGDSIVQAEYGEECDDGNTVSGDRCSFDCLIEITEAE